MAPAQRISLTAEDWASAALDALAQGGLAAVAVEPIAKVLGTTKGSFYWHFADRTALLEAALALWERRSTDLVIASVDDSFDPATRLRRLLHVAFNSVRDASDFSIGTVELALQANAAHPLVAPVLERVTKRRLAFLTQLYLDLGIPRARATDSALLAYTAFVGHAQIAHATAGLLPQGREYARHVNRIVETLADLGG